MSILFGGKFDPHGRIGRLHGDRHPEGRIGATDAGHMRVRDGCEGSGNGGRDAHVAGLSLRGAVGGAPGPGRVRGGRGAIQQHGSEGVRLGASEGPAGIRAHARRIASRNFSRRRGHHALLRCLGDRVARSDAGIGIAVVGQRTRRARRTQGTARPDTVVVATARIVHRSRVREAIGASRHGSRGSRQASAARGDGGGTRAVADLPRSIELPETDAGEFVRQLLLPTQGESDAIVPLRTSIRIDQSRYQ